MLMTIYFIVISSTVCRNQIFRQPTLKLNHLGICMIRELVVHFPDEARKLRRQSIRVMRL